VIDSPIIIINGRDFGDFSTLFLKALPKNAIESIKRIAPTIGGIFDFS
jgi:hypothetical protein